jgi:hypothetical protein
MSIQKCAHVLTRRHDARKQERHAVDDSRCQHGWRRSRSFFIVTVVVLVTARLSLLFLLINRSEVMLFLIVMPSWLAVDIFFVLFLAELLVFVFRLHFWLWLLAAFPAK